MKHQPTINIHNQDCMEPMAKMADNAFELAIVDPPYGIGWSNKVGIRSTENKESWDNNIPHDYFFSELMRVSKNQIIWGGNYFPYLWSKGCKCYIFWYKQNPVANFSDGELAWTSFDKVASCFEFRYYGGLEGNKQATNKIHPTQKPVALYKWLLKNYANEGDKILDTHLGSGSIAIACHDMGFDLEGYEIDHEYYQAALQRLNTHRSQLQMF